MARIHLIIPIQTPIITQLRAVSQETMSPMGESDDPKRDNFERVSLAKSTIFLTNPRRMIQYVDFDT